MKINKMQIVNFKSVNDLTLNLQGSDAVIMGENGTGKTSVLDAVIWLFTGKVSSGKRAEISNLKNPSGKIAVTMEFDNGVRVRSSRGGEISNLNNSGGKTVVTMEFDNGVTLRRENSGYCYVQGVPCKVTDFKAQVDAIFKGAVPVLLSPFNFCEMHYADRRNILLSLFAKNVEVDASDLDAIFEDLKKLRPEQIIQRELQNLKQIKAELAAIPARINELSKQGAAVRTVTESEAELRAALEQNAARLKAAQNEQSANFKLKSEILKLENSAAQMKSKRAENELMLKNLREEYSKLQTALLGKCPLCGAKIESSKTAELKAQLAKIIERGKTIAANQELLKKGVQVAAMKIEELRQKLTPASDETEIQKALIERDAIQSTLSKLKMEETEARRVAENERRIEELKTLETEYGTQKTLCDKKIYQASEYVTRRIKATESKINAQFEFVTFKMFDTYKVSDGVKECCEPMMNGIPYEYLSKGEKLKASLDILKALQKAYGVEMPVFIDDAESYTSNSLIDVPNQKILLRAIEGVKTLSVQKVGVANGGDITEPNA